LDCNTYQRWTIETAIYPQAGTGSDLEIEYLTLGLVSEAGEVAGKVKKKIRDGKFDMVATMSEVSDCLWYIARLADALGMTMEELADLNYGKLTRRKEQGTLGGSGDGR
jgi:NTP pyrophosphatase (non-canonical NTP hydrolase)